MDGSQIRIQILDANEEAGAVGRRAVTIVRSRVQEIAGIGRELGAEALLICPAVEGFAAEGIEVVIGARFGVELDDEAIFWRQRNLTDAIDDRLNVRALVLDLDLSLEGYISSIRSLLAAPYRDELGMLRAVGVQGI